MNLLDYYQNQCPINDKFVTRKYQIPEDGDINLFGVRGSGKSSIVFDFLEFKEDVNILYIDMDEPNLIFNELTINILQTYIDENKIEILVLDHYEKDDLPSFPNVQKLIVVSRICLECSKLTSIEVFPLDYEEFLAHELGNTQNRGFNNFLRLGTLPALARSQKTSSLRMKQFFSSSFDKNEQKLLLVLAQHHTRHLTTHQIYTYAKDKFKVSKDWLYKTIKLFSEEKIIHFIEDKYHKSGKKMLFFDFAFAKYLTSGQPFIIQFDAMIALAFLKHNISVQTLGIHGYITRDNELIIPAPFESEESLWVKSQNKFATYKKYDIKKVTIVTVANSYEYSIEKLNFEALPFDEWSVINNEDTLY